MAQPRNAGEAIDRMGMPRGGSAEHSREGRRSHDRGGERTVKVRATFHLPEELMNDARNTVVALSGPPHRLTLAKLAENALRSEIERLKSSREGRQRGQEFPQRTDEVRTGRPIGAR